MDTNLSIQTHSGRFHTDDVTAVVILLLAHKTTIHDSKLSLVRSRDLSSIQENTYVVDVGGVYDPEKRIFDHHQKGGTGMRESGIPYSSAGLVWKEFGLSISDNNPDIYERIDTEFITPIDAHDNGIDWNKSDVVFNPLTLQSVMVDFIPSWKHYSEENLLQGFKDAVAYTYTILQNRILHLLDEVEGEALVEEIHTQSDRKEILVLDKKYPWHRVCDRHKEILFVISPDFSTGNWTLHSVRKDIHSFESRCALPEEWAGKRDKKLQEVTGVADAVFVHNKRFIAVAESKEGVLALAHKALQQ